MLKTEVQFEISSLNRWRRGALVFAVGRIFAVVQLLRTGTVLLRNPGDVSVHTVRWDGSVYEDFEVLSSQRVTNRSAAIAQCCVSPCRHDSLLVSGVFSKSCPCNTWEVCVPEVSVRPAGSAGSAARFPVCCLSVRLLWGDRSVRGVPLHGRAVVAGSGQGLVLGQSRWSVMTTAANSLRFLIDSFQRPIRFLVVFL